MARVAVQCANPKCKARYSVEEAVLGKQGKCSKCGITFVLTRGTSPAVPTSSVPADSSSAPHGERPRGEDGIPVHWEPGDVILDLYLNFRQKIEVWRRS